MLELPADAGHLWAVVAPSPGQGPDASRLPAETGTESAAERRGAGSARGVNAASLARGRRSPPRDLPGELLSSTSRRHFAPARLSHRGWAPSCPARSGGVSLLREREVFEGGLSLISSSSLDGCPGSTHTSPWCLGIAVHRNCLTFPRPLCCPAWTFCFCWWKKGLRKRPDGGVSLWSHSEQGQVPSMGQTIWADPGQTQPEKTAVHHLDALLNKKHLKAVASLVLFSYLHPLPTSCRVSYTQCPLTLGNHSALWGWPAEVTSSLNYTLIPHNSGWENNL